MTRRVLIVTGSRAEYGLLANVIRAVKERRELACQLLVTGSHLSPKHGKTIHEIEADGFKIDATVDLQLGDDGPVGVATSLARGVEGIARALDSLKPDILVLLGDRFEILAAAQAALIARIPVAHIHGGESSEAAVDEAIRHAVTKMAHLHFVSCAQYRQRVIQLGEAPHRVHVVGALAVDSIQDVRPYSQMEIATELGIDPADPYFLITYHPVTLSKARPESAAREMLDALSQFPEYRLIFTGVNADPGSVAIDQEINAFAKSHSERARSFVSLGHRRYISAVRWAAAVVGNSSSGMIEAPFFHVPTVNIGPRQNGRLRTVSIIDCDERQTDILAAIKKAVNSEFLNQVRSAIYPFGNGGTGKRIAEILASESLEHLLIKQFYDLPETPFGRYGH